MTDLATAYANAGKALLDLADAIAEAATTPPDAPPDLLPFEDDPEPHGSAAAGAGSASVCPAHNIPYRSGRYGSYCPSTSDDPKWSNEKGWCTVTPKNAAAYLRQKAAVG